MQAELAAALRQVNARQGARGHVHRRPDGDVRRPRRALHEARLRRDRGQRRASAPASTPMTTCPHYFENRDADQIAEHFVDDIETGHAGHRDQGGVPQVRGRRRRGDRERREGPPRRARGRACRPARRSWPTRCRRPAPARARSRSSSRRASRPRRSRSPTAATAADVDYIQGLIDQRRVRRPGPLRTGDVPADGSAQRGDGRAAAPRPRRAVVISQDYCATIDWFPAEVVEQLRELAAPSTTGRSRSCSKRSCRGCASRA